MGFRYQELKERGDSIELERRESFTTERSHNGFIKRKKTILRERFPHPNAKDIRNNHNGHRQHKKHQNSPPQSGVLLTTTTTQGQQQATAESGRTTTETFGYYTPGSRTLLSHCRDKSHLERAVNRTSVQLKRLAHEIDNEIAKLKRERDKLMLRPRPHPLMRNAAIQNNLQQIDDHTLTTKLNLNQFNAIADNIEFTIEKFSSQHKFVCTSPRYARDEQTSCRPRMRTIGLQKDTQRNSVFCDSLQNLKAKLDSALHNSATNLANLKAKGLLDPAPPVPPNCYAFDYGGTGDGSQNALKIYHLQNCRCAGGCNPNECNCQKICERYNTVGNYNGLLCNKNTYVEKGVTPCSEYKYCRDEYHYDYPRQNSPCAPCVPYQQQPCQPCQPCPPCMPCLPPCPTYNAGQASAAAKPKMQVIYGRRMSDLNTDEFYHPTGTPRIKHTSPPKHGSGRRSSTKERLTVDVPKDGRTSVDIERHDRAHSKSRRRKDENEDDRTQQRGSKFYEGDGAPDKSKTKRQARDRKSRGKSESSGSIDSAGKTRHMKNKEKLLEITFTKERRRKPSSGSGDEGITYEREMPVREYTREAKRSMKQMTITAYKPCKPDESEDESDGERKKRKRRKSKEKGADSTRKSDDDKTWDERLRKGEEQPREEEAWADGIPTITEFYDDYRVGDAWEADEDNVANRQQYIGTRMIPAQVSPKLSYDIMPVQKDTVRDIPPSHSPSRGRRFSREGQRDRYEEDIARKPQRVDGRDTTESGIGRDSYEGTGIGYTHRSRSDSYSTYGAGDKTSDIKKASQNRDYDVDSTHASVDKSKGYVGARPGAKSYTSREYSPDIKSRAEGKHSDFHSDKRYAPDRPPREDYEPQYITTPKRVYAQDEGFRSAREYDSGGVESKTDKGYVGKSEPRTGYGPTGMPTSGTAYHPDGKQRSAPGYGPSAGSKPDKKYLSDSPSPRIDDKTGVVTGHDTAYTPDGKRRSPPVYGPSAGLKPDKKYLSDSPSPRIDGKTGVEIGHDTIYSQELGSPIVPISDKEFTADRGRKSGTMPAQGAAYTPDGRMRSLRDSGSDLGPRYDKRFATDSPPLRDHKPGTALAHDTVHTPNGKPTSAPDIDPYIEPNLDKRQMAHSPTSREPEHGAKPAPGTVYTPDGKYRFEESGQTRALTSYPDEKVRSPRVQKRGDQTYKPNSASFESRSPTPDTKHAQYKTSDYDRSSRDQEATIYTQNGKPRVVQDGGGQKSSQRSQIYDPKSASFESRSPTPSTMQAQDKKFEYDRGSPRDHEATIYTQNGKPSVTQVRDGQKSSPRAQVGNLSTSSRYVSEGPSAGSVPPSEKSKDTAHGQETKPASYRKEGFSDQSEFSKGYPHLKQDSEGIYREGYSSDDKTPIHYTGEKERKPKITEDAEKALGVKPDSFESLKMSGVKTEKPGAVSSGSPTVGTGGKFDSTLPSTRGPTGSPAPTTDRTYDTPLSTDRQGPAASSTPATGRRPDTPLSTPRAGKNIDSPTDLQTFRGDVEVPEIHIEDDSGRSGKSGKSGIGESGRSSLPERAKFAIKGEMVLEAQQSWDQGQPVQRDGNAKVGEKVSGVAGTYRKPDTRDVAEKDDRPKSARSNGITASSERFEDETYRRRGERTESHQQLSPFPSLESPRIYMRPRTPCPDYKTACLPHSSDDCKKKSSPRGNCCENAGDVYMCQPDSYNDLPQTSPCSCLPPTRSSTEIPYEKLGDQYTHSPVRQLAANSHLAVALQPDAATGNYVPSPQPKMTKNCVYLRSTGTQYSATIIENHEDRCAPQYIPLPKECNQMLLEGQEGPPPASCYPQSCETLCEDFQPEPCIPQTSYKFLCEEENECVCEDEINPNNEQWCQRVEITNSEKTQIYIAQQQQRQHEQQKEKENSPRSDCKNYFLPWQEEQKFIPGQPMNNCDMQDPGMQQRSRYQSLADRRTPRFNATMPPHQEMPEEEARCAQEMMQYKPQPRVKFLEQNLRQYENSDPCDYSKPEVRPGFHDCREYQQIPKFTGCPCMFKTYLNMITLYYPDCRIRMPDDDDDDAEGEDCCCDE